MWIFQVNWISIRVPDLSTHGCKVKFLCSTEFKDKATYFRYHSSTFYLESIIFRSSRGKGGDVVVSSFVSSPKYLPISDIHWSDLLVKITLCVKI